MFRHFVLLFAILPVHSFAGDDSWLVWKQESALANALNTRNEIVLSALTDKRFTIQWSGTAFEQITNASEGQATWLSDLGQLKLNSYDQSILKIQSPKPDQATVTLDEHWTILSPQGGRIEKRFHTTDFWLRSNGIWKLVVRDCRPPKE